jgi:hypothetical protein
MAEKLLRNATPFIIANPMPVLISDPAKDVSIQNGQQPEISALRRRDQCLCLFETAAVTSVTALKTANAQRG